jgi:hypothetical protein
MKSPGAKVWAWGAVALVVIGLGAYLNRPLEGAPNRQAAVSSVVLPTPDAPASKPAADAKPAQPATAPAAPAPVASSTPPGRPPVISGTGETLSVELPTDPNKPEAPKAPTPAEYRRAANGPELADCALTRGADDLCRYTQPRFLTDWTKARDGDIDAARRVALCVGSGCSGAVKPSPIEGCAWSLLIAKVRRGGDDADRAYVAMTCSELPKDKVDRAYERAAAISSDVHLRDTG